MVYNIHGGGDQYVQALGIVMQSEPPHSSAMADHGDRDDHDDHA